MSFPIISLPNQYMLREMHAEDSNNYMNILNKKELTASIPKSCIPSDLNQANDEVTHLRNLFHNRQGIYWAIANASGELIGTCGFETWHKLHNRIEIAYELDPNYWRQGITSNAIRAISYYAFNILNINRIDAYMLTNNTASAKLLTKIGYTFETMLTEYRYFNGEYRDVYLYYMCKNKYESYYHLSKQQNIYVLEPRTNTD